MKVKEFVKIFPLVFGSGATLITGCDVEKEIANNLNNTTNIISEKVEDNSDNNINREDLINKYQIYYNKKIPYHNEEYFLNENDVDDIINNSRIKTKNNYVFDGNIDKIIDNIKNNSNNVLDDDLTTAFNENNKEILENILRDIFEDIKEDNNNLNSDFHIINDLKILTYKDNAIENFVSTYIKENNTIIINYNEIKALSDYYNMSFEEQVRYFITKEINMVRKNTSLDDIESTFNYKGTNDSLIYDGTNSIELLVRNKIPNNLIANNEYIFTNEMKYQGELLLLGITNNDKDVLDNYFAAVNDNNVKELWHILNLNNKEDITSFYEILYAMDAKLYRNTLINSFYDSNSKYSYFDFIGLEYKLNLYNKSVSNLLEFQKVNDITISENLVLYNIILNAIVNNSYRYENNEISYDPIFMDNIYQLNECYLDYLSDYYQVSREDIDELIKYDVRFILIDMASIMHHDDKNIAEFIDEAQKIMDKYPLTKAIMASDYIYTTQFNKALDNAQEKVKKL